MKQLGLGDFLKHIRTRHGLTQAQMGDLFFRNKDYVYLVENNKTVPTAKELAVISEKLNEPLVMLITYGLSISQVLEAQNSTHQS